MTDKEIPTITVGDLRERLSGFPDSMEIMFSGCLTFYRIKQRGDNLLNMEFNEQIYRDEDGELVIEG